MEALVFLFVSGVYRLNGNVVLLLLPYIDVQPSVTGFDASFVYVRSNVYACLEAYVHVSVNAQIHHYAFFLYVTE